MLSFRHTSCISNSDAHAYSVEHNGAYFGNDGDGDIDAGNVPVLVHNGDGRDGCDDSRQLVWGQQGYFYRCHRKIEPIERKGLQVRP